MAKDSCQHHGKKKQDNYPKQNLKPINPGYLLNAFYYGINKQN